MSDSEHSTVTYTSVSFPVEDDSDIGSPGVDGPPIMPEDPYAYIMAAYEVPPSPDYIPGPEVPPSFDYIPGPEVSPSPDYIPGPEEMQSPLPLDFVPEPIYLEYIPQEDEILSTEEQPLPAAASPTADSPGYVLESDPEEDDEDPKEDPADYPADRDDDDDEDDDEDEEEEEHPAPADSVPPVHRMTARISIRGASQNPYHFLLGKGRNGLGRTRNPYSVARGDLYGFVDMVDVAPRHPMSRELDYGITDTWDDLVGAINEISPTTLEGVNQRVTDLSTVVEQETTIIQRFQELALMCDRIFLEEIDQVEKYVGGFPHDPWHVERQADNKRKSDDTANQQPNKRQNTKRSYATGNGDRRPYGGPKPLCSKCNYHHEGPCAPKCHKCNQFGHLARNCRNPLNVNTGANQRACFECGAQGHFKKDCLKLKNNNNRGVNPDNNVVTGTFLLNNQYASILFDTSADRSFVSTAFISRIVITPTALDHDYNVELADRRIVGLNTIIQGCTLNFLNHPFNIDLIPVEIGSFDVIIGMDWLVKYDAIIFCAKKIVRIPFGDETLIVRDDGSSNEYGTRLNIISCTKAQEYLTKGCHVFLANISATKDKDKSKGKRLEDVPVVQKFPEVFPEDLPGIPHTRQVEFRIDLVPGATPVAHAPYRLAP
ncbi:putative reverse transcriptase domain-containing protein, partial [Tanacetum coccineum]